MRLQLNEESKETEEESVQQQVARARTVACCPYFETNVNRNSNPEFYFLLIFIPLSYTITTIVNYAFDK